MKTVEIDFVVPWVDGSDPEWQKEFRNYSPDPSLCDASFERYRDWDLLKYWFRGVEANAPWVRKIFFITWGHVPEWLDVNHPKLVIVNHEDYIPEEYLPTFSSHPIELNMHRIEGLSEHFVYFNDDSFLIDKVNPEDFFVNGLPCDMALEHPTVNPDPFIGSIFLNNTCVINRNFRKREVISSNLTSWFNPKYGKLNLSTIMLTPWNKFVGLHCHHYPQSYIKESFNSVWKHEFDVLNETSQQKFRSRNDVNQYVIKCWQICNGNFYPTNLKKYNEFLGIGEIDNNELCNFIKSKEKKCVVLNDECDKNNVSDIDVLKHELIDAMESITKKSSFEL